MISGRERGAPSLDRRYLVGLLSVDGLRARPPSTNLFGQREQRKRKEVEFAAKTIPHYPRNSRTRCTSDERTREPTMVERSEEISKRPFGFGLFIHVEFVDELMQIRKVIRFVNFVAFYFFMEHFLTEVLPKKLLKDP